MLSSLYFGKYLYFQHLYTSEILVQNTNRNILALILFFFGRNSNLVFFFFFSIIRPVSGLIDFLNK